MILINHVGWKSVTKRFFEVWPLFDVDNTNVGWATLLPTG